MCLVWCFFIWYTHTYIYIYEYIQQQQYIVALRHINVYMVSTPGYNEYWEYWDRAMRICTQPTRRAYHCGWLCEQSTVQAGWRQTPRYRTLEVKGVSTEPMVRYTCTYIIYTYILSWAGEREREIQCEWFASELASDWWDCCQWVSEYMSESLELSCPVHCQLKPFGN